MAEKLLTLIGRERGSGCHDVAVFGGFGSFVAELGDPGLTALGQAYAAAPRSERPALLDAMERRVKLLLGTTSPAPEAPSAPAHAAALSLL